MRRSPHYFLLLLIAGLGCSSGEPAADIVDTVPAAGILTYQDKPLEHYQVTFYPEASRPAAGTTDENGRFVLGTNREGDGAVAGGHRVTVTYVGRPNVNPEAGMNDFSPPPPPKVKIPPKYRDVESSGLAVNVPESGSEELRVELK